MRNILVKYFKWLFLLVILSLSFNGYTQNEFLSLDKCQEEVQKNYPLIKGREILKQSSQLNVENLRVLYLPKLYVNGKVSYQSEATGVSIPGMVTAQAPKDQYALNVDVEQLIYDGGKIKNRVKLETLASEVETQGIDIQMYQLKERVNSAYFSILLIRKNRLVLVEKQKAVQSRLKQVRSAVRNGMMLLANQKILESELLLLEQDLDDLNAAEESVLGVLSELMGKTLDQSVQLQEFSVEEEFLTQTNSENERPEYAWYTSQKQVLDEQSQLVKKERYPLITGFGQMGYGNPGYNQMTDEFDTYYMLGLKVSWNIFDWKLNARKRKEIGLQKDLVQTHELSFMKNQNIELRNALSAIKKVKMQLEKDDAIIELQQYITGSSSSQLDNGVITSSDYLDDLNKEIQAKLNKQYHFIQLQQSLAEYKRIKGIKIK